MYSENKGFKRIDLRKRRSYILIRGSLGEFRDLLEKFARRYFESKKTKNWAR